MRSLRLFIYYIFFTDPFLGGRMRQFALARIQSSGDIFSMTATAVIEEIEQLPPEDQSRVIQFVNELARKRQLSGEELGVLVQRMVNAKDTAEIKKLRREIHRGFYGE